MVYRIYVYFLGNKHEYSTQLLKQGHRILESDGDIVKVDIKKVNSYDDEHAELSVVEVTDTIQSAIDTLENNCRVIAARYNDQTVMCQIDKIYYIESIDKRTYIYTKDNTLEVSYRLYELESELTRNFFRAAKAMIINIRKIKSVKSEINGRMTAELLNGEQVIIARSYVKELKERLGI
jgi:response regulator receiver protein